MNTTLPRPRPEPMVFEGRYVRLEPLTAAHAPHLFAACAGADNAARFDFLFESPPQGEGEIRAWIDKVAGQADPMFFAVIDRANGRCAGRQALMRITPEHGVIEVGSIYWGAAISRTRASTEACYLHLAYAFDRLGYRRFEWKCNDRNEPSKRAAHRFGFTFEGLFRQHMVVKGVNRDTAWFSILDTEWPAVKAAFERWLAPENFDSAGHQRDRLDTWAGRERPEAR